MPASDIDFTALTHVIHFALLPNSDGTLNYSANEITSANSANLIAHAHAAGGKALICVGGADSESGFRAATSSLHLMDFINSLTNFVASRGYDGVDLDWEPLSVSDIQAFTNLVNGLRSALDAFPKHKMLTTAVGAYPPYGDPPTLQYALFAALQDKFDQINIMTYDLSGPYSGWVTWFNSPIYDGGFHFPNSARLVPSVNGSVTNFLHSGMKPRKLGVGVPFYGYVWTGGRGTSTSGVTRPRQSWTNAPSVSMPPYTAIMTDYYQSNFYKWDNSAQAAYLSISNSNPAHDMFISYDDPRTCQAKVNYARDLGLGGIMIWEIGQDHQSGQPDALLQSIKHALSTPRTASVQLINRNDD
jgi:chitinase